jgi:hypothetical protein
VHFRTEGGVAGVSIQFRTMSANAQTRMMQSEKVEQSKGRKMIRSERMRNDGESVGSLTAAICEVVGIVWWVLKV